MFNKLQILFTAGLLVFACKTNETVIEFDGGSITHLDAKQRVSSKLDKIEAERLALINSAAESILEETLLTMEAESQELEPNQVVENYLKTNFAPVSDFVIKDYYNSHKAKFNGSFSEAKSRIVKLFEIQQKKSLRTAYLELLKKKYNVKYH